jgi:glyoxylate carboligase
MRVLINPFSHAMKMTLDKGYICMKRCDGSKTVQTYDREKEGRTFICVDCKFEVCTDSIAQSTSAKAASSTDSVSQPSTATPRVRHTKHTSPAPSATLWSSSRKLAATRNATAVISSAAAAW